MPLSKETLMLRAIWRKAYSHPEPIEIPCESDGQAEQLRLRFYNAVKVLRKDGKSDQETAAVIEDVTLRAEKATGTAKAKVVIGHKRFLRPELGLLEQVLGQKMEELATPEEREAAASAARLARDQELRDRHNPGHAGDRRRTPYYDLGNDNG